jgi:hypothetical protein
MAVVRIFQELGTNPPETWKPQTSFVTGDKVTENLANPDNPAEKSTGRNVKTAGEVSTADYVHVPWILTCQRWLELKEKKFIALTVNPQTASLRFKRRQSSQVVHGGKIRHSAPRRRIHGYGQSDEPVLNITFQSSSIVPIFVPTNKQNPVNADTLSRGGSFSSQIPAGMNAFHMLMDLLNENVITDGGQPNYQMVFYHSLRFPHLMLTGYFDPEGPTIEDGAEGSPSMNYSLDFEVYASYPRLHVGPEMARVFFWGRSAWTGQ